MSFFGEVPAYPVRTYDEEMRFLDQVTDCKWRIRPGFVPNMRVPGWDLLRKCRVAGARLLRARAVRQVERASGLPASAEADCQRPSVALGLFTLSSRLQQSRQSRPPHTHRHYVTTRTSTECRGIEGCTQGRSLRWTIRGVACNSRGLPAHAPRAVRIQLWYEASAPASDT